MTILFNKNQQTSCHGKVSEKAAFKLKLLSYSLVTIAHAVAFYKGLVEVLYAVPSDMELVFKTLFTFQTNDQLTFRAS